MPISYVLFNPRTLQIVEFCGNSTKRDAVRFKRDYSGYDHFQVMPAPHARQLILRAQRQVREGA